MSAFLGAVWAFIPAPLRIAAVAAAAAFATWSACSLYDRLIDDPAVAREARRGLVAAAELEAVKADRDAAERIAAAARARAAREATANVQLQASLALADDAYRGAIDDLEARKPDPHEGEGSDSDCRVTRRILGRLHNR